MKYPISPAEISVIAISHDWSGSELAHACGCSQSAMNNYEHGRRLPPEATRKRLWELANALRAYDDEAPLPEWGEAGGWKR